MFSVAVINIKGIVKYLCTTVLALIFISYIFPILCNANGSDFYYTILNQNIPGIAMLNNNDYHSVELSYIESKNPLHFLLNSQLPVMSSIELATVDTDEISMADNSEENVSSVEHALTNLETQVIDSGVPNKFTNNYNGVEIKNGTNYALTDDILSYDSLDINKSNIMIFHTHTCESYTPTEAFPYEESGTFRTTDLNFSVSRVGDALSDQLLSYGYNVTHDKTYHDYPAYSGSYR